MNKLQHVATEAANNGTYPVPSQRAPITPGALLTLRYPSDPQISPDGKRAAFVVWEFVGDEQKQRGRIWTIDTSVEGAEPKPLTKGAKEEHSPRWSPDGKQIAYISTTGEGDKADKADKAKPQLHIISAEGGTARQVCTMPNGVLDFAWSLDGNRIAFLSLEGEEPKSDPKVIVPARHRRLWTVYVESDVVQPVTPDSLSVWEYAWSPDSRQIAMYYSLAPDENGWYNGQVGVVPLAGGAVQQLTHLTQQASGLVWTPDGTRIAYVSGDWSDRGYCAGDVYSIALDGSEPRNLTPGIEFSPAWLRWSSDGKRLLFAAYSGVTQQIGVREENGQITLLDADFVMSWPHFSTTADLQTLVTTHTTSQQTSDIWLGRVTENSTMNWRRLTRLNPLFEATYALAKSERIRYESVDGWQIDALLTHPLVRKTDGPPPLVVNVHGGPSWAWSDDSALFWTQMLASAGFAVLRPNVRGSWGRGVKFADAVVGDMGGKDYQDILRGVDYLVSRGLVDGTRVGICGWSYGGFMTAWAISQTTRFKAAVMGAGISDWHSFHAQSNLSDWDVRYMGADLLDDPELYRKWSPITYARRITTPTLILHGENDQPVPVNQGYAFQRALHERGVPVEFVIYPREGHGPGERNHLLDIDERVLRWFEKYL